MTWKTFTGKTLQKPIIDVVRDRIQSEKRKGFSLKVCIGTDSQVHNSHIRFATAVVFVREKHGGFMLINYRNEELQISVKERMLYEVAKSIETAHNLYPVLQRESIYLEVHADINTDPAHASYAALKEASGYIKNMGYHFKAKPDAFASSACADRMI